ncbi:hypothetical protein CEXT_289011 [Caerostris extrusa]|uniref:Uncharacterized protein n=1 Tax=Caerostris extrusa TaxID=172846 RepID=A0AAV4XVT4_CAEEX|nr:hypothetical protein CEXT_289011 [Caerostris extrusa]
MLIPLKTTLLFTQFYTETNKSFASHKNCKYDEIHSGKSWLRRVSILTHANPDLTESATLKRGESPAELFPFRMVTKKDFFLSIQVNKSSLAG